MGGYTPSGVGVNSCNKQVTYFLLAACSSAAGGTTLGSINGVILFLLAGCSSSLNKISIPNPFSIIVFG